MAFSPVRRQPSIWRLQGLLVQSGRPVPLCHIRPAVMLRKTSLQGTSFDYHLPLLRNACFMALPDLEALHEMSVAEAWFLIGAIYYKLGR